MKRINLFAGHYGSGKTNIAVNFALKLRAAGNDVVIADLDIVNPYFRTKDSSAELEKAGIRLISSEYANTNVDMPALPQDIYSVVDVKDGYAVLDIGGDDRGAYALGRYAGKIKEENNFDMFMVVNCFRPLTRDAESTVAVMNEISSACAMPFTAIINNSNIGDETTAQDVISGIKYAENISALTGLPVKYTCVMDSLANELSGKIPDLFPLHLQSKIR